MKKLTLNPESLEVQSFSTSEDVRGRGTVQGEQLCTCPTNCTCPGCPSCAETCPATCPYTCDDASCGTCIGDPSCGGASCWDTCERTCYTGRCICYQEP